MKSKSAIGRSSRQKGQRGERLTCSELREALPEAEVRRGLQSRSGHDEPDVIVEIDGRPVLVVEVKTWTKRPSWADLVSALEQAEDVGERWECPAVAVIREDRREPAVVLRVPDVPGEVALARWRGVIREIAEGCRQRAALMREGAHR